MVYQINIEKETLNNNYFRKVLNTTNTQQLVVMSIKPGENIPSEIHPKIDQFIRVEKGNIIAKINGIETNKLSDGDAIMIPANTQHEIINPSTTEHCKLYTIYSPPNHPPNRVDIEKPKEDEHEDEKYEKKYLKYKNKYLLLKKSEQ
ncbi:mannose-6-phosphate isomerase, cupin superfamily [Catovirus CTV1]|uniref:Mannose-6-phosphate isomerase, cupin superfamily n=1 Tax=Catovirus CTV1 TaxID=1977631 RepID=A0A1V0S970_9VIRU|nr:mannose-6-phosphate isomerase, cupin superfamily [Catovirus CTV1]